MEPIAIILLNFEEVRRRSIKLWTGIPETFYNWRPDEEAMTIIETVRHVLESEYAYYNIVRHKGSKGADYVSPWENRPYTNVADELEFAEPYRHAFLDMVRAYSAIDLEEIEIIRAEVGQRRKLGDYLLRIAYHESVHTGQMLTYLRAAGAERPKVWD